MTQVLRRAHNRTPGAKGQCKIIDRRPILTEGGACLTVRARTARSHYLLPPLRGGGQARFGACRPVTQRRARPKGGARQRGDQSKDDTQGQGS